MHNAKTLKLDTGQVIPDRFNAFFAALFPKRYAGKGKHNPACRGIPIDLINRFYQYPYRFRPIA